jgi:hypothetical protein
MVAISFTGFGRTVVALNVVPASAFGRANRELCVQRVDVELAVAVDGVNVLEQYDFTAQLIDCPLKYTSNVPLPAGNTIGCVPLHVPVVVKEYIPLLRWHC